MANKPQQIATKAQRHEVKHVTFWLILFFVSWWRIPLSAGFLQKAQK
jgi:hypothetical protein